MSNIPHIKDKIIGLLESECCRNDEEKNENNMSFILCQNNAFDAKLLIGVIDKKDTNRLYIQVKLNINHLHWVHIYKKSYIFDDWLISPASSFSNKPIIKILQRKNDILDFFTCCSFLINPYVQDIERTESTLVFNGDSSTAIKKIFLSFETRTVSFDNLTTISIEDFVSLKDIICNNYEISYETLSEISSRSRDHIFECAKRRKEEIENKKNKKKININNRT